MPKTLVAPDAINDLERIAEDIIERLGLDQAVSYREGILEAIELLAENPHLETAQESVMANAHRIVHQSYAIYYEVNEGDVVVLRILGPGQDPTEQFR